MSKASLPSILFVVSICVSVCCDVKAETTQIRWVNDFESAVRYASSNNLPLMLHFYGDSCPPCRMLEKRAFQDAGLVGKINGQMIAVKINGDRQRELRDRYQITSWPTDVFLTPTGEELHRTTSPQDPSVYGQMIDRVALQFSDWKVGQLAKIKYDEQRIARRTSTQILQQGQPATPKLVNGSTSHPVLTTRGNELPRQPSYASANQQGPSQQVNHPSPAPRNRLIENPYVSQGPLVVPPATEANPQPTTPNAPINQRPSPTTAPTGTIPQLPSPVTAPYPATGQPAANVQVVAQPISSQASLVADSPAVPPAPAIPLQSAESIPHGLEGYCPVSLVHAVQGKSPQCWVEGVTDFAVRHRGRIYLCASEENRRLFLSQPDRYAPALSSYDLIHFVKTGELIDGKCEYGSFQPTTGRVFLFATPQNCQEFQSMEKHYSDLLNNSHSPERVAIRPEEGQLR
jgi:thiol-disulfide isomerase/thioredoxin/YHS domain-containing protein